VTSCWVDWVLKLYVEVVRRGRLLWFGHVERKSRDDWVKMCRDFVVEGTRRQGRGGKHGRSVQMTP
jgi:hypothetical protein